MQRQSVHVTSACARGFCDFRCRVWLLRPLYRSSVIFRIPIDLVTTIIDSVIIIIIIIVIEFVAVAYGVESS